MFQNLKRKATRSSSYLILKFLNTSVLLRPPFRRLCLKLKRPWKSEKRLSHRNKLILIADSSEEGWEVVNEYQRRDLADDSDDDKRIRQAEVRASQKRRHAQLAKKSSSFCPQKPSTPLVPSLPYVVSGYGTPVSPSYPAMSLPGSNFFNPFGAVHWRKAHRGSRVGSCFACCRFGHFRNQCPVLQVQLSASQPGKRT